MGPQMSRGLCVWRGPWEAPHHVVPWPHRVLLTSTCHRFYSMWNSLGLWKGGSPVSPQLLKASFWNQGVPPPISLSFHCCPLSLCSLICVPTSPCLPAPPPLCLPPHLLQPAWATAQPPCLAVLPGSPSAALSWPHPLPPPSAGPLIRLWTQRSGAQHKAPGHITAPWHSQRPPHSPREGHGGGLPHQVCVSIQGPWPGSGRVLG